MKTHTIYGENRFPVHTRLREACRGIVTDGSRILMTYEVNTDQWFVPGGGLEPGETLPQCCARELAEETGCIVEPEEQFLTIREYYEDWLFISHYFLCRLTGKTRRVLTEREAEVGLEPRWIELSEALDIFSRYEEYRDDKLKWGSYLREYEALRTYSEKE